MKIITKPEEIRTGFYLVYINGTPSINFAVKMPPYEKAGDSCYEVKWFYIKDGKIHSKHGYCNSYFFPDNPMVVEFTSEDMPVLEKFIAPVWERILSEMNRQHSEANAALQDAYCVIAGTNMDASDDASV